MKSSFRWTGVPKRSATDNPVTRTWTMCQVRHHNGLFFDGFRGLNLCPWCVLFSFFFSFGISFFLLLNTGKYFFMCSWPLFFFSSMFFQGFFVPCFFMVCVFACLCAKHVPCVVIRNGTVTGAGSAHPGIDPVLPPPSLHRGGGFSSYR